MAGTAVSKTPEAKVISNKQLTSRFVAAVAMTALVGASAFAESRPSNVTRTRGQDRSVVRRERVADATRTRRGDESRNRANPAQSSIEVRGERNRSTGGRIERDRAVDRTEPTESRGDARVEPRSDRGDRSNDNRSRGTVDRSDRNRSDRNRTDRDRTGSRDNGTWRNDSRSRGTVGRGDTRSRGSSGAYGNGNGSYRRSDGRYNTSRYGNRQTFHYNGRVHRVYPYGGGYRVWLTGCQYPFFIPSAYYNHNRFRVGLTIALGGFYNSRGYYDYYDDYDNDRYYDVRTSRGELRGVVESVDYRRETFVVRNDATGSFVTVAHADRGRDPVRAGDYVELGGDWTRSGVFEAYRVDIVDSDSRR